MQRFLLADRQGITFPQDGIEIIPVPNGGKVKPRIKIQAPSRVKIMRSEHISEGIGIPRFIIRAFKLLSPKTPYLVEVEGEGKLMISEITAPGGLVVTVANGEPIFIF